jgi:hypothetical protein
MGQTAADCGESSEGSWDAAPTARQQSKPPREASKEVVRLVLFQSIRDKSLFLNPFRDYLLTVAALRGAGKSRKGTGE